MTKIRNIRVCCLLLSRMGDIAPFLLERIYYSNKAVSDLYICALDFKNM